MKGGGGSVVIWSCMSAIGCGKMFIYEGRMNPTSYTDMPSSVLGLSFNKLFTQEVRPMFLVKQDNASCHISKASEAWFQNHGVLLLDWPPQSPDLNQIEHLWPALKKDVAKHNVKSTADLKVKFKEKWQKMSNTTCAKLVDR